VKALDEIATYTNGLALQKYPQKGDEYLPVIKIAEMRRGVTDTSDRASPDIDAKYIVQDGDVLFSWSGTLLVSLWCGGPGALNQHLFKVTSAKYPKWLYYWATQHHLDEFRQIAANKVTTMGHIQRQHLAEALVAIPPGPEFQQIDRTMSVILDKIIECDLESRQLAATRDYLLPRLLAGEVVV
jgi:type I restriction enzyme S subunit